MEFTERQQAEEKVNQLINWFKEVREQFNNKCTIIKGSENSFYFKGNREVGTNYELNTWKKVPIFEVTIKEYQNGNLWIDCRVPYSGAWGSESYLNGEYYVKEKIKKSFEVCINDFVCKTV